jgi:hypothetical protein
MGPKSDITFYLAGNVFEGHPDFTADNTKFIDNYALDGKPVAKTVNVAFASPAFHTTSAEEALRSVMAFVGACLPARDPVDTRLIGDVKDHGGKIINSERDVGGWPELKSAAAPVDSDHDGIPDEWELAHGLNPNDPSDGNKDMNGDGYTNLEKYLDGIDPSKKVDYREVRNDVDPLMGRVAGAR